MEKVKQKLGDARPDRREIFSVPNGLSFLRLCLIPWILYCYNQLEATRLAAGLFALSALIDVADGAIARRSRRITRLGRILDPVAGKLTQAALLVSLAPEYKWTFGLAVLFAVSLFWGSVALTPQAVLAALTGRGQDALSVGIITQLRLPRAVMAALLGAALSAAGYLLQTFFANPIAGPFVMGISSGAKLAVALVMVLFLNYGLLTSSAVLILAAFAGAMAAMAFVLAAARRVQRMSILVICGVMIGYICSAITEFVVAFAQDSSIVNLHNWSQGSFSGMTWSNVRTAALVVLPALAAAFCLAKPMAAYQMGEAYARSVGVDVRRFSRLLVLLSSLLAACVTAFAGPISFVGIAVPHLVKQLLGSARPLYVLPGCCLGGAAFCLLCDLIARSLFAPMELSISAVTAVFGAPVVIGLLLRRNREDVR